MKTEEIVKKEVDTAFTPCGLISMVYRCIPNAEQIQWIEIGEASLRFSWRGTIYKIWVENHNVDEIRGAMIHGSDSAALISMLLKKQWLLEKK